MRGLVIVNPRATTTSASVVDVIIRALSSALDLTVARTAHRGHGITLAEQARADGVQVVVAIGGDGIANEALNGLLAQGPADPETLPLLAVIPGGSANVLARALGLPADPVEATGVVLDSIQRGRTRTIGLGLAETDGVSRWFAVNAGLGLDAEIIASMEEQRRTGKKATPTRYLATTLRQFAVETDRHRPALRLMRPGTSHPQRVFLALVQNTAPWTYFGPWPIDACPNASFDSGLDVFAMRSLGIAATVDAARRLITRRATIGRRAAVVWHDQQEFTVEADHPIPLQLDGEGLGAVSRVDFTARPRMIRVVCGG